MADLVLIFKITIKNNNNCNLYKGLYLWHALSISAQIILMKLDAIMDFFSPWGSEKLRVLLKYTHFAGGRNGVQA